MDEPRNESAVTASTEEPSHQGLTTRWETKDLDRFEEAAKALSQRDHGDYTKTDIIRMGARRFAAEILGGEAA